jgi:hypothetical protein
LGFNNKCDKPFDFGYVLRDLARILLTEKPTWVHRKTKKMRPPGSQGVKGPSAEKKNWFAWKTWFQNRTLRAGINCLSVLPTQHKHQTTQSKKEEIKWHTKKQRKSKFVTWNQPKTPKVAAAAINHTAPQGPSNKDMEPHRLVQSRGAVAKKYRPLHQSRYERRLFPPDTNWPNKEEAIKWHRKEWAKSKCVTSSQSKMPKAAVAATSLNTVPRADNKKVREPQRLVQSRGAVFVVKKWPPPTPEQVWEAAVPPRTIFESFDATKRAFSQWQQILLGFVVVIATSIPNLSSPSDTSLALDARLA